MLKPASVISGSTHQGRVIEVSTEKLVFADGREHVVDLVRHPGAAAVVAVDEQNRACFVRQYRHAVADFLWEVPAGKRDPGEGAEDCARRELLEETGVQAQRWVSMGLYYPAPGILTEVIYLFLASGLEVGAAAPDPDEDLELQWVPLPEALRKVTNGEWNDGKTALALLRARHFLAI